MIPLLADCMLNISYHGTGALATIAFDEDGGANTEGEMTLTVDGAAVTVDTDAYNTLATLVPAIAGAAAGWRCVATPGLVSTMSTEKSGLAQRLVNDMATTTVDKHGVSAMVFINDYEVMGASATTTLISSVPIPTGNAENVGLVHWLDGADAGATGNATFNYLANRLGAPNALGKNFPNTAYDAAWDTVAEWSSSPVEAINGSTAVQATTSVSCVGMPHIKLATVINADDAVLNVKGWYSRS